MKVLISFLMGISILFAVGNEINMSFKKEGGKASYYGSIKGYDYDTYSFYGYAGQKISVTVDNVDAYLFGDGIIDSVDLSPYSYELDYKGAYKLPTTGRYEIKILQTRNDARKNRTKSYSLDIKVE